MEDRQGKTRDDSPELYNNIVIWYFRFKKNMFVLLKYCYILINKYMKQLCDSNCRDSANQICRAYGDTCIKCHTTRHEMDIYSG